MAIDDVQPQAADDKTWFELQRDRVEAWGERHIDHIEDRGRARDKKIREWKHWKGAQQKGHTGAKWWWNRWRIADEATVDAMEWVQQRLPHPVESVRKIKNQAPAMRIAKGLCVYLGLGAIRFGGEVLFDRFRFSKPRNWFPAGRTVRFVTSVALGLPIFGIPAAAMGAGPKAGELGVRAIPGAWFAARWCTVGGATLGAMAALSLPGVLREMAGYPKRWFSKAYRWAFPEQPADAAEPATDTPAPQGPALGHTAPEAGAVSGPGTTPDLASAATVDGAAERGRDRGAALGDGAVSSYVAPSGPPARRTHRIAQTGGVPYEPDAPARPAQPRQATPGVATPGVATPGVAASGNPAQGTPAQPGGVAGL